mgnify:CR=1 FL=1
MKKPDFIIIGAMKSATSTLHEQLSLQEGIFMTTPKEPNYFSDDAVYAKGDAWYEGLFSEAKEGDLCGESSTHYTKLPDYPLTLLRMKNRLKAPKLVYVMRHPVDRLVSHYIHQWSRNIFKCDINSAIDQYDELIDYGCYAKQVKPYIAEYGVENILFVFMEAIKGSPQAQLEKVADFIGYQGQVVWQEELPKQNISSERIRVFPGYKMLTSSAFMKWIRHNFIPKFIRNVIKARLRMRNKPEINNKNMKKLVKCFDRDLRELAEILGFDELTCSNYKSVVID